MSRRAPDLDWSAHGTAATVDGERWTLNSEHVRHEGRWWYFDEMPTWARQALETMPVRTCREGTAGKRGLQRLVARLVAEHRSAGGTS